MRNPHPDPAKPCRAALLGLLVVGVSATAASAGPVIYVDASAPPGGNGVSWTTAFDDLQDALAVGTSGMQIWVAAGTYTPTGPGGDRLISFDLVPGVQLYGGFAGGEQTLDERDWVLNETILSGDLNGDDGPDFANNGENSYHVVFAFGVGPLTRLDGFIVIGGNADAMDDPDRLGGGMYIQASDALIANCVFRANWARWGGGIYSLTFDSSLSNCRFEDNAAEKFGGGLRMWASDPVISGCSFVGNIARDGGGLANATGDPIIIGCSFLSNSSESGAGLHSGFGGSVAITDSVFEGNAAAFLGGGLRFSNTANADIDRCTIRSNVAQFGGGIQADLTALMNVRNCLFAHNEADMFGGGFIDDAGSTFVNCAFSRNTAGGLGGDPGGGAGLTGTIAPVFINCSFSLNVGTALEVSLAATLYNCILWGNEGGQLYHVHDISTLYFCDIQGGWSGPGSNNMDADPLFVEPIGADDLRLSFGSPCIDAGDNSAVPPEVIYDLAGMPRIQNGIVDIGAYEGEYEPGAAVAFAQDINLGDMVILNPSDLGWDPLASALVAFRNVSGQDGAWAQVTQYTQPIHPDAAGYSELGAILSLETSLADGQFLALVTIPFSAADLAGADPAMMNITYFDASVGNWGLAVAGDTVESPGSNGPMGTRVVLVTGGPDWGIAPDLGDWGVYWDPALQGGFAWANVDHASDFALGAALCPPDCGQTPDGMVAVMDLLALLTYWGDDGALGPCDQNQDGTVDIQDLIAVFETWGPCP